MASVILRVAGRRALDRGGDPRARQHAHRHPRCCAASTALELGDPVSTRARARRAAAALPPGRLLARRRRRPARGVEPAAREVLIEVEEGRTRSAAYGAGYDSESGVRGSPPRCSENNLFGRLVTVQLRRPASRSATRRTAPARAAAVPRHPGRSRLEWSLYREPEDRPVVRRLRAAACRSPSSATSAGRRVGLVYDYRLVDLDDRRAGVGDPAREPRRARRELHPDLPLGPPRRSDRPDPRLEPAGQLHARAFPAFDADADFAKTFVQATGYRAARPAGRARALAARRRHQPVRRARGPRARLLRPRAVGRALLRRRPDDPPRLLARRARRPRRDPVPRAGRRPGRRSAAAAWRSSTSSGASRSPARLRRQRLRRRRQRLARARRLRVRRGAAGAPASASATSRRSARCGSRSAGSSTASRSRIRTSGSSAWAIRSDEAGGGTARS